MKVIKGELGFRTGIPIVGFARRSWTVVHLLNFSAIYPKGQAVAGAVGPHLDRTHLPIAAERGAQYLSASFAPDVGDTNFPTSPTNPMSHQNLVKPPASPKNNQNLHSER